MNNNTQSDRIFDNPETNYNCGSKTYCRNCKYYRTNNSMLPVSLTVTVNGKKKKVRIKYNQKYCIYKGLHEINGNHLRWWGFSKYCEFNIFSHTCIGCGTRMCTEKKICSGCLKNNYRFKE